MARCASSKQPWRHAILQQGAGSQAVCCGGPYIPTYLPQQLSWTLGACAALALVARRLLLCLAPTVAGCGLMLQCLHGWSVCVFLVQCHLLGNNLANTFIAWRKLILFWRRLATTAVRITVVCNTLQADRSGRVTHWVAAFLLTAHLLTHVLTPLRLLRLCHRVDYFCVTSLLLLGYSPACYVQVRATGGRLFLHQSWICHERLPWTWLCPVHGRSCVHGAQTSVIICVLIQL